MTGKPCPERADHAQSERETAAPAAQYAVEAVIASETSAEPTELTVIARECQPSGGWKAVHLGNPGAAELLKDGLRTAVADTGIGISTEDLARLGRPFKQMNDHFTRSQVGLGLGLALCRDLVELHGGRIAIRSVVRADATVSFMLPQDRIVMESEAA